MDYYENEKYRLIAFLTLSVLNIKSRSVMMMMMMMTKTKMKKENTFSNITDKMRAWKNRLR